MTSNGIHGLSIPNFCGGGEIRRYCGGYFSISKADNEKSFSSHTEVKQFTSSPPQSFLLRENLCGGGEIRTHGTD